MPAKGWVPRDGQLRARYAGSKTDKGTTSGQFTIPARIYRAIPEDAVFRAELTEEGVLYRYLGRSEKLEPEAEVAKPTWAQ